MKSFSLVIALGLGLVASLGQLAAAPARPNIVLILADDLGYSDLGCFGAEIATPNLDKLAQGGLALTQFYNQARCCPTRAALMTGRYPHQVGIGEMIDDYAAGARRAANTPAYQDHLSTNSPTLAEVLRGAGYRTLMSGKWHLGKRPEEWPVRRGFDRSFVLIDGAMNYYGGDSKNGSRTRMAIDDQPYTPPREGFYSTDAFTAHALEFIQETVKQTPAKPFFLYLPYNASHWPLQAPEEDVAKYRGKYDQGWQAIRQARLERMIQLGIVPADQKMAPMDRGNVPAWEQLTEEKRREWARKMEVYAAQTEHLDRSIGKLLAELEQLGLASNTVVIFLSDNGGAAEDPNSGDKNAVIGSRDSYRGYGRPWATVSNTPWKRHKVSAYEGGISTPLLVRWPAGIPTNLSGQLVREAAHVTDLMPTLAQLAGASYPHPEQLAGQSLVPLLHGQTVGTNRIFCWEHEGNRGLHEGKWKLVSGSSGKTPWELYDLSVDRVEANNLAAERPEVVQELTAHYQRWAEQCGVIDFSELQARRQAEAKKKQAPSASDEKPKDPLAH